MPGPKPHGREGDRREEVCGELVIACCDAAKVLELVEASLDEISLAVDFTIDHAANADVALRGDMRGSAIRFDLVDDGLGEVTAVGNDVFGQRQAFDESGKGRFVRRLAGRQKQANRQAVVIHDGVDLGGQSSTRTTDGVIRTPFFPPAACWWARTIDESMR